MRKWRSLTALRACEAVARTGSVSAAAAELHVTHPAISKQIALLEEDMGCALFERTGNRIRLTDAGQELYAGLKQAFDLISSTTDSVARRSGQGHRVRLLVCRDFASGWLAGQLGVFLVANPGISVEITTEKNDNFRPGEDFDFRIFYGMHGLHGGNALIERELCRWIDIPVCTQDFADRYLQAGQRVCDAPYLVDNNYDVWDEWCHYAGFDPGGERLHRTLFNETTMCVSVAASGGGLTIGDSFLTLPLVLLGELIVPFGSGVVSAKTYSLFTSEKSGTSEAANRFEQWLRGAVAAYQSTVQEQLALRGIRVIERAP
jgi:LysR family glycine cleavage system transcriptional activator/LysR family transcriptional regulator of beta-lactamase